MARVDDADGMHTNVSAVDTSADYWSRQKEAGGAMTQQGIGDALAVDRALGELTGA